MCTPKPSRPAKCTMVSYVTRSPPKPACVRATLLLLVVACEGRFYVPESREVFKLKKKTPPGVDAAFVPDKDASGRYICDDKLHPAESAARRITQLQYQHAIAEVFGGHV